MTETPIFLSHPDHARSRADRALADAAAALPGVEVAHLEGLYPDARIDADAGFARLVAATAGNTPSADTAGSVKPFAPPDPLEPLHSTAHRCGLDRREPFLLYETEAAKDADLAAARRPCAERLRALGGGLRPQPPRPRRGRRRASARGWTRP